MATNGGDQGKWYTATCDTAQYTLPVRYQELLHIGQGAFGAVIRAKDTETGKYVAIKKILDPFRTTIHAKRTYRELKLLMYLNHPDADVVRLYNVFTPEKNLNDFQTLYFVFNYVDYDLSRVIKRRIPFEEKHIKQIIYSLLRGLKYIHSAGILHRDLKPGNIGIDKKSNVTILDFGLARSASNGGYTTYVETRWWRAPEVIICRKQYDEKLDIWSVGCIMAELILLRPVFRGTNRLNQLDRIFDIIGTPDLAILNDICTPDASNYLSQLQPKSRQDFNELFGYKYDPITQTPIFGVSPEGLDLLDCLLTFDHRTRPTAEEALAHPFLKPYHDSIEEPTTEPIVDEHQNGAYTIVKWKSIIWQMVEEFVPPTWINDQDDDDDDD
ncbi:unnamed protein product [Rotaria sp. Silwood1]|nr:unnamed protein product [Rotaria sp. Silwood1]CAF4923684.1 unnamed protein product [Rotaria sp. Silwood1]